MKSYVIESGIPMPSRKRKSRFGDIQFSEMAVGQSVLLDTCTSAGRIEADACYKQYKAIYSSIYKLLRSRQLEGKFKLGTITKRGKTEIRLWRVE